MPPDYLNEIEQYNISQARPKLGRRALLVIDMQQHFLSIATPILGNIYG
jgi:isochorismate hydrolase